MLTKKQKITIEMFKNRGYDVKQIIEHFINTRQEATSWDITIHWMELCDLLLYTFLSSFLFNILIFIQTNAYFRQMSAHY